MRVGKRSATILLLTKEFRIDIALNDFIEPCADGAGTYCADGANGVSIRTEIELKKKTKTLFCLSAPLFLMILYMIVQFSRTILM